jgi:hypothetical protein
MIAFFIVLALIAMYILGTHHGYYAARAEIMGKLSKTLADTVVKEELERRKELKNEK